MKMNIKKKSLLIGAGAIALLGFGYFMLFVSDVPITVPNVNEKPLGNLEIQETVLINAWGDVADIEAGKLVVPENREDLAGSNHIEIFFCRFKTANPTPVAPIFFLAGGPGSAGTSIGTTKYFYLFKELVKYGDVILIDQRGTGNSVPNLNCRNNLKLPTDITENVREALLAELENKIAACGAELNNMGIQLASYTTRESTNDLEALRTALGYQKITLYGYSYGTTLAQDYIGRYEQNVEKAILAGPIAPDQNLKLPFDVQKQFQKLDSLAKLDKRLSKYVPSYMDLMSGIHQKFKSNPELVLLPLKDALDDDAPLIQEVAVSAVSAVKPAWDITITDDHLQMVVAQHIGSDRWLGRFPAFYYQLSQGNYREVGNMVRNFRRKRLPNALFFTVNGATSFSEERWKTSKLQGERAVLSDFGISYGRFPNVTQAFGIEKQPSFNDPISSNTKMLLIGGTLDGRTPISNLDTLSKRFPNSTKIIIENGGHNNLIDNTIMDGIVSFIIDSVQRDITITRNVAFLNPVPYKYSMSDTLRRAIENRGVEEALQLYNQLEEEYGQVADYIFDFGEHTLNTVAYSLMEVGKLEDAKSILVFATQKFSESYNLYNSLAEANLKLGDSISAKTNLKKAIIRNFFDGYSQTLLHQLKI